MYSFSFWNKSVVPCLVLTVASWPAYKFLKRLIRWSAIPISFRIFHSLLWSTHNKQGCLPKTNSHYKSSHSTIFSEECLVYRGLHGLHMGLMTIPLQYDCCSTIDYFKPALLFIPEFGNYDLRAKYRPPSFFASKGSLECSHIHSFIHCLWSPSHYKGIQ